MLNAPAPVMLYDETGRILLLSRAWLRMTGYTADDLRMVDDWHATASQGERRTAAAFLRRVIEREPTSQSGEFKFLTKDGRRCDWSLVASTLGPFYNRRKLFLCVANDVTDLRRNEARSKESEEHFRQLLEALPAAVYTTDATGRITFFNRAAIELWGRQPVLGEDQWCGSWRLYWPDGRPMAHDECPMAVALKEDRSIRGAEAIAERPDGTRVSFTPYPTPLHDATGRLVGAVNMLVDITGRKRALRRLHLLAREVDHRTKNMLAVIQGLVHFTRAESAHDFAVAIEGRIMALARAHSLLSDNQWDGADVKTLVECELESYRASSGARIHMAGGHVMLGPAATQSIALVLHELAANAVKHGVLRKPDGQVDVRWSREADGQLSFIWEETGGGPTEAPRRNGFGITLIERTISDQLDGELAFEWHTDGMICRFQIPIGESISPGY